MDHPQPEASRLFGFPLLVWLAVSAPFLAFAIDVWPPLAGDPIGLVPAMTTFAREHELRNPIWAEIDSFDLTGAKRLVNHGFLYAMATGLLASSPDNRGVVRAMYLMNCLTLALCVGLFVRSSGRQPGPHERYLIVGATLGTASMLSGLLGRPDPFATLVSSLAAVGVLWVGERRDWVPAGAGIGVLGASHPVAAVLAALVFLLYCGFSTNWRCAVRRVAWAGALALVAFLVCLWLYPYPVGDWIAGLLRVATPALVQDWGAHFWSGDLLYYWLLVPRATGFGLVFLVALPALATIWVVRPGQSRSAMVVTVAALLLATGLWAFVFRNHARSYNAQLFVPLVFATVLRGAAYWRGQAQRGRFQRARPWLVAALVWATGLGFLRQTLLFVEHKRHGISYEQARASFERLRQQASRPTEITTGMFLLTEDYQGLRQAKFPLCSADSNAFFISQAYSGRTEAPLCPGFRLSFDGFVRDRPQVLGMPLGRVAMTWGFALYERQAAQATQP